MNSRAMAVLQRWALFRFDLVGPVVVIRYRDSAHPDSRLRFSFIYTEPWPSLHPLVTEALFRLTGPPIQREGPHGSGPLPLAVYYSLPRFPELDPLRDWFLRRFDDGPLADLIQPVSLSRAPRISRPAFSLPIRVLALPQAFPFVQGLANEWWLRDPVVREYGLHLAEASGDLATELRVWPWDILVAPESRAVTPVLRRLPVSRRPRLLIGLDDYLPSLRGVAVLSLPPDRPEMVFAAVLAIVHDCPLHEVAMHLRRIPPRDVRIQLLADPRTDQALRMREAFIQVRRDATRVRLRSAPALFLDPSLLRPGMVWPASPMGDALREFERADPASLFQQESTGLTPLARLSADLAALARWSEMPTRGTLAPVNRRIDATLFRLDTDPFYQPLTPATVLEAGARYDLRVHIGAPQPESLVQGDVTPIEGLLETPDSPEGYRLTVSVQGKDFRVARPGNRQLLLPLTGSSDAVYFRIRAPRDQATAELRICLYHRNHLIQTLLLQAAVAPIETEGSGVRIVEEFSRTVGFTNLDALQPRAMSIALNQGPQGSHQIHIVGDNLREDLDLSADAFGRAVLALRSELRRRLLVGTRVRIFAAVPPGSPPAPQAAQAILGLARQGWQVYRALFDEAGPKLQAALQRLQRGEKEKIQVVRLQTRSAFPWSLLYDWPLPKVRPGEPDPPVCLGTKLDAGGNPGACGHDRASRAICVRGFWGLRHLVEELLPQKGAATSVVLRPSQDPVWVVSSSAMTEADDLVTALKADLAAGIRPGPWAEQQVLDLLWQTPPARPAVMILLGHLVKDELLNEARIELEPGKEWFTLSELQARRQGAGPAWTDPRTILVLAACESAATTDDTLNDFVTAFNSAGAAAIVGTQVEVGLPQAVEFAHQFTAELWRGTLGSAMHAVRNQIVRGGDPGGFLFQSFGDVDLRLQ